MQTNLRLARFRRPVSARLCRSDGVTETYLDLYFYPGQNHLVGDWDEVAGGVVLYLIRPRGSVLVPADSFEWVTREDMGELSGRN